MGRNADFSNAATSVQCLPLQRAGNSNNATLRTTPLSLIPAVLPPECRVRFDLNRHWDDILYQELNVAFGSIPRRITDQRQGGFLCWSMTASGRSLHKTTQIGRSRQDG